MSERSSADSRTRELGESSSLSELRQRPIERLRELHPSLTDEHLLGWVEKLEELLRDLCDFRTLWKERGKALTVLGVALDDYLAAPDIAVRPRSDPEAGFGWEAERRETAEKLREEVRAELEGRKAAEDLEGELRLIGGATAKFQLAADVLPPSGKSPWRRYFAHFCADDGLDPVHMSFLHASAFKRFGAETVSSPFTTPNWQEEQTRKWAKVLRELGIPSSELKKKRN